MLLCCYVRKSLCTVRNKVRIPICTAPQQFACQLVCLVVIYQMMKGHGKLGLPVQAIKQACIVWKRFPFPWQPPQMNSAHLPVLWLKPQDGKNPRQGPVTLGRLQTSEKYKTPKHRHLLSKLANINKYFKQPLYSYDTLIWF